jgi:hypothetical protein
MATADIYTRMASLGIGGSRLKMPSEAELIEIARKFDFLLEISDQMESEAANFREDGIFSKAEKLDGDAEILEAIHEQCFELIELVRSVVWVPQK